MKDLHSKAHMESMFDMTFEDFIHTVKALGHDPKKDFNILNNGSFGGELIEDILLQVAKNNTLNHVSKEDIDTDLDELIDKYEPAVDEETKAEDKIKTNKSIVEEIIDETLDETQTDTSESSQQVTTHNDYSKDQTSFLATNSAFEKPKVENHSLSYNFASITPFAENLGNTELAYVLNSVSNTSISTITFPTLPAEIVNIAPEGQYDIFFTNKNEPVTGNLLIDNGYGADIDLDGSVLLAVAGVYATDGDGIVTVLDNGDFTYTPLGGYSGADHFVYSVIDDNGAIDTADVTISVSANDTATIIDFSTAAITGYGGASQNRSDTHFVEDDGNTIHIEGNTWKDITLNYTVTANTILEFDFMATSQSEIQGIGFDTNERINSNLTFKVYGTQNWGIGTFNNYGGNEGNWVHYEIDVGNFYTGNFNRLFFTNDDDSGPTGNSFFRNIVIHEPGTAASETMYGTSSSQTLNGLAGDDVLYGMDGDDVLYGGSGIDFLFGGNGADTFAFNDMASVDTVHDFNISEGDMIDISDLLIGYDPITDAIQDFVMLTSDGQDTFISVDADGGADNFVVLAKFLGVTDIKNEDTLETSGTLLTV
jgi:hypothetical protein